MKKNILATILIFGGLIILGMMLYVYSESKKQQATNKPLQNILVESKLHVPEKDGHSLVIPASCSAITVGDLHDMCDEEVLSIASPEAQACFNDLHAEIWPQGASGDDWIVVEACTITSYTYINNAQKSESLSAYIDMHFNEKYKSVRPKQ